MIKAKYLEVLAGVRYWKDAEVNGVEDVEGNLIPFRQNDLWKPIIDIENGVILDWPQGMIANVHYKVCDQGKYYLLDENKNRIAQWRGYYVPDSFLCHGDQGFGDYIIFDVDQNGKIKNYQKPVVDRDTWVVL